jgi:hypothetical protein
VLFAVTLFVSAGLLFLVQPMVGKMILPLVGGSPALWNTCMVFFQALLLLGYLYAHKLSHLPSPRKQVGIHLGVIGIALLALGLAAFLTSNRSAIPIWAELAPTGDRWPILNVVGLLAVAVGVPFFAVSTTAPLLQRWFAGTGHPSARDPYFLYAASNAGSLLSLVSYPLLTEPLLRIVEQTWLFAGGFLLLGLLTALCGWALMNPLRPPSLMEPASQATISIEIPLSRKLRWLALAFVPSSLMLGVTTHLTTDIATIPLLWVVPLGGYLLTFIIAYTRGSHRLLPILGYITPALTLLLVFTITSLIELSVLIQIVLHVATFFSIALLMHTELARLRPDPKYLTEYFLWVSLGGVLGGVVNGLLAPIVFPQLFEYPLALVAGCLLMPSGEEKAKSEPDPKAGVRILIDLLVPFVLISLCAGLRLFEQPKSEWFGTTLYDGFNSVVKWTTQRLNGVVSVDGNTVRLFLLYAPPCLISFFFIERPLRFGLAVCAILFVFHYYSSVHPSIRSTTRSYFGVLQIRDERNPVWTDDSYEYVPVTILTHGTTIHGREIIGPVPGYPDQKGEPLNYYHRTGPVGDLFRDLSRSQPKARVAVVGLGAGSIAAYVTPEQSLTFFEIDRTVVQLVEHDRYFSFLTDARKRGATVTTELGDARLTLARQQGQKFDLLILDAFSSDAIPIHLMTVEAMRMYADHLADDGLIAFHVSNRYLKLEPVVAAVAERCGLTCRVRTDDCEQWVRGQMLPRPGNPPGRTSCTWIVLAKNGERLTPTFTASSTNTQAAVFGGSSFAAKPLWQPLNPSVGVDAWTDDFANVVQVIRSPELQRLRRKLGFTVPDLEW